MSKSLYCPNCSEYLEGGDGECHDCLHCGWQQPQETTDRSARIEELERRVEELEKPINVNNEIMIVRTS
ncbi:MAG: hypothetical protein NVS3B3_04350 [Aquirhabdus sp.]